MVLLPGVKFHVSGAVSVLVAFVLADLIYTVVNQLISAWPSDNVRDTPSVVLLLLAVVGVFEDSLVWLLISWATGQLGLQLGVSGYGTALLAGLISRTVVLALMALPRRGARRDRAARDTREGGGRHARM
ncbi:hypothetical protein AB0J21_04970 [Streptomyces sp. NPDC049954]|uniref:hypothetical protein n=1 Tax=Streptomyces sp. NPDC049954 TaxID=3155779 RepID=UPI0034479618